MLMLILCQSNDLKSQHIADEVRKVIYKTKKNSSDILGFESRLKQKEDILDNVRRESRFFRGVYYLTQKSYLVYECKAFSSKTDASNKLTT